MTHANDNIVPAALFGGSLLTFDGVTVEVTSDGRNYIALGQPGFNSPTNNRGGYPSIRAAVLASQRYAAKGRKARGE